mgnify:CR=1 FL=1
MPYCIARALLDGEMTLAQFAPEKLTDPEVRDLMDKIEVEENQAFKARYGESFHHRMVVHTADGETYEHAVEFLKGHYENPLTREDRLTKFERAADGRLPEARVDDVVSWVEDLESKSDLSGLFERCTL